MSGRLRLVVNLSTPSINPHGSGCVFDTEVWRELNPSALRCHIYWRSLGYLETMMSPAFGLAGLALRIIALAPQRMSRG